MALASMCKGLPYNGHRRHIWVDQAPILSWHFFNWWNSPSYFCCVPLLWIIICIQLTKKLLKESTYYLLPKLNVLCCSKSVISICNWMCSAQDVEKKKLNELLKTKARGKLVFRGKLLVENFVSNKYLCVSSVAKALFGTTIPSVPLAMELNLVTVTVAYIFLCAYDLV